MLITGIVNQKLRSIIVELFLTHIMKDSMTHSDKGIQTRDGYYCGLRVCWP